MSAPDCVTDVDLATRLNLAPPFFGLLFSYLLLGTLFLQVYLYYLDYKRDPWSTKFLVYGLLFLELLHTAFSTQAIYAELVEGWGNASIAKGLLPPTSFATPLLDGIISAIVQSFFALRIWRLGGKYRLIKFICGLIVVLALLQSIAILVGSTALLIGSRKNNGFPVDQAFFTKVPSIMIQLWASGMLATDVIIAATMTFLLLRVKHNTPYRQTNDIISKILRLSIQTGIVTAICPIVQLPLGIHFSNTALGTTTTIIIGKIYTNSLLANLNARRVEPTDDTPLVTLNTWSSQPERGYDKHGLGPVAVAKAGVSGIRVERHTQSVADGF